MYYLASPYLEQVISFSTKATSQPKLALFRIGNMSLNYPAIIQSQQKVVEEIESKFSIIDEVEKIVEESLKKAEMLRKSILKSAFEGKLVK
jgi:type I restriction enzyme S subunit